MSELPDLMVITFYVSKVPASDTLRRVGSVKVRGLPAFFCVLPSLTSAQRESGFQTVPG